MKKSINDNLVVISITLFLFIMGAIIFLNNFQIFDEPKRKLIAMQCDDKGLRNVSVFSLPGNASANPSIHVAIKLGCHNADNNATENIIFTADQPFINGDEVNVRWLSFDTLEITYSAGLRVFKEYKAFTYKDSTLNLVIEYQKK